MRPLCNPPPYLSNILQMLCPQNPSSFTNLPYLRESLHVWRCSPHPSYHYQAMENGLLFSVVRTKALTLFLAPFSHIRVIRGHGASDTLPVFGRVSRKQLLEKGLSQHGICIYTIILILPVPVQRVQQSATLQGCRRRIGSTGVESRG